MAAKKRKNLSAIGVHYYDPTNDTYPAWEGDVNLQVGGADVSSSNPVPISDATTIYPPIIDTTTTANTVYFGFAAVGSSGSTSSAIWRIMRMVESSGVYTFSFADGNTNFDNVWNNRASLSYS